MSSEAGSSFTAYLLTHTSSSELHRFTGLVIQQRAHRTTVCEDPCKMFGHPNSPERGQAVALGIDLAWSDDKLSGCVALDESGQVISEELLRADGELFEWVGRLASDHCVLAIDAPLVVPNESGQRECEWLVAKEYGARHASPHSSNRYRLIDQFGRIRGEQLTEMLRKQGFDHAASVSRHQYIEVYPHPAIVEMFGLDSIIKYKSKKQPIAVRRAELRRLNAYVSQLAEADPPLLADPLTIADNAGGSLLKGYEDLLDARICAWIASAWHQFGAARVRIFGRADRDHIAIPNGRASTQVTEQSLT